MIPKINNKIQPYSENKLKKAKQFYSKDCPVYEPVKGEKITIIYWVRYPSYDFIFGIPHKTSPKYKKEVGFFQFRDTRAKKVKQGLYIDIQELEEMIEGFARIKFSSQKYGNKHLWKKYDEKSN